MPWQLARFNAFHQTGASPERYPGDPTGDLLIIAMIIIVINIIIIIMIIMIIVIMSIIQSISEISSCFFGPRLWRIEIRHRVKKASTMNLFGFETLKLKNRRLKLWKPGVIMRPERPRDQKNDSYWGQGVSHMCLFMF